MCTVTDDKTQHDILVFSWLLWSLWGHSDVLATDGSSFTVMDWSGMSPGGLVKLILNYLFCLCKTELILKRDILKKKQSSHADKSFSTVTLHTLQQLVCNLSSQPIFIPSCWTVALWNIPAEWGLRQSIKTHIEPHVLFTHPVLKHFSPSPLDQISW